MTADHEAREQSAAPPAPVKGRVVVQGLVFDWTCDASDIVQVYNWRYGLHVAALDSRPPDAVAKFVALQMIGAETRAARQEPDPRSLSKLR